MRKSLVYGLAAAVLGAAPSAFADVYRWIDERGTTSYGEKPPRGARNVTRLTMDAGNVSVIPAAPARAAAPRPQVPERADLAAPPLIVADDPARWRERCIAERRVDCENPTAATFDFAPPFARLAPFR